MDYTGGNALFRWTRKNPAGNGWIFQAYYNRTATTDMITLDWEEDIYDLDFQHSFTLGERQLCTWGLAYRYYRIHMKPDETSKYSFDPEKTGTNVTSAFVQDEIDLIRDKLLLTLGSKFEYHETTHLEVQPTGRLLWRADKQNTLWTAVSRAVRTPSRGELDAIIDTVVPPQRSGTGTPLIFQIVGNDDVESGEVLAFELGYRTMINDALSLDMTGFYNRYENLLSAEQPTGLDGFETEPVPHAVAKSYVGNDVNADTYGIELSANWRPADTWRLRGTYTYTEIQLEKETDQPLIYGGDVEGKSPEQMVSLRSLWEPVENVEIDARLRFVDRLEALEIPSYFEGDLRLAYKPRSGLEISLAGRNLLDSSHPEFAQLNFLGKETAEVERSVYGRITWRF